MKNMPLTLYLIVAAIVLYFYLRRASLGVDTHPGEQPVAVMPPQKPSVFIGPPLPEGGPVTLGTMPPAVVKNPVSLSPSGGGGDIN